ncbi:hypothetical protein D3C84_1285210 [compost metagenome]
MTDVEAIEADIGAIGKSIQENRSAALGWHWSRFPDGTVLGWGTALQEYQAKKISRDELLKRLDKVVLDTMK